MNRWALVLCSLIAALFSSGSFATPVLRVAVASNFASTAAELFADFEQRSGVKIVALVGSTGKHAAQIQRGLLVDVFLAADSARPQWLLDNGLGVEGSRITYARGRLALFSVTHADIDVTTLNRINNLQLAIANPKTAPYGQAAIEFLESQYLGINSVLRIVKGESVAQAFQFAASGAADAALIAYSQIKKIKHGSYWLVPSNLHKPINQQALLIRKSEQALTFLSYLQSNVALSIIKSSGYEAP